MTTAVPLASGKGEIFEIVLKFMPDWIQVPVLCLIIGIVVLSWLLKLKRWISRRRAVRSGASAVAVAQQGHGQGRGADYLGQYAPQQPQQPQQSREPSGADFLGSYAPQQQPQRDGSA
ncbi:hypothetical protein ACFYWX_20340 [Streptomyces sp. NPDC002888]|uniref:hypothetical protein n=1 Tax=Streptomyces sp. NPDC002888 TaxID=3364668 RepID=UPI0036934E9F